MSARSIRSLAERRVRRQKHIIAVGSVVLLAILGFELPKLLSRHGSSTAEAVTTVSPSPVGSSLAVPAAKLPDTDRIVVARDSNQLVSFGLFRSKDPFIQQLSANPAAASSALPETNPAASQAAPGNVAGNPGATAANPAILGSTPPASTTPNQTSEGTTPPATTTPTVSTAAPSTVLISTNGTCEQVTLNGTFPLNQGIFRVVWIAKDGTSIKVAVVGGSFDNGETTATVKLGEKLTLVNTADGSRYVIALEKKCGVIAQPSGETSTTPVATPTTTIQTTTPTPTTPTPTPTTTETTPIVTDSMDTTVPSS